MRTGHAILLLLAWLMTVLPAGEVRADHRFAIIAASNVGATGEETLRYAERDAVKVGDVLFRLGGLRRNDTEILLGASAFEMNAALDRMSTKLRALGSEAARSSLIFYFAGHGDKDSLHLGADRLMRQALIERIRKLPAGLKMVVLDACLTPWTGRPMGVAVAPEFDVAVTRPFANEGLVLIRSSREGEPAYESDSLGGSMFTHYLVSALRGAGDADRDGRVTLFEAYAYAYRNTVRQSSHVSDAVQHPSFDVDLSGSGDLVLTEPIKSSALLVFPPSEDSRVLVFGQPSGIVLAEAVLSTSGPVEMAVPPGRMLIQRRIEGHTLVAQVDLPFGGRREVAEADYAEQPHELVARRGGMLDLSPNLAAVGYAGGVDLVAGHDVARQGTSLLFSRRLSSWLALGVDVGVAFANYSTVLLNTRETAFDVAAGPGWILPLGVTSFELHAGLGLLTLYQSRQRKDSARLLASGLSQGSSSGFSLGPEVLAGVRWWLPLGTRWLVLLDARARGFWARMTGDSGESWRTSLGFAGGVGLALRF